jgi:3-oxoacyl-[acyl-carrier-protein] synthase II
MKLERRAVVVTGIGVICALGTGKDEFWRSLLAGRSGVRNITLFGEDQQCACRIAAEIPNFDPTLYLEPKQIKRTDRFIQLAVAASRLAVEDAALDMSKENPERVGVAVGSAAGGFASVEEQHKILMARGPSRISPFTVPMIIVNMAAGWISILHGAKGPNTCSVTACATSSNSIGDAARIIERGEADVMLAGGTEAPITPLIVASFAAARTLSCRNDAPERASRPFDKDRDGFVMGEGAAVLVLESKEHALKRGARIYAEFAGYAQSGDAYDIVQPCANGEGAARTMQLALHDAGLKPSDIMYVNAHGTSTPLGDRAETQAIKSVFKEHAGKLAVSSTKSMTGHLLGAAGGIEAAACTLAIYDSAIPPTINLENPDPECDLDYVPNKARLNTPIETAMSNSFGFGGHNACLIFKKFKQSQ